MKKLYTLKGRRVFQEAVRRGKRFSGADLRIIVQYRQTAKDIGTHGIDNHHTSGINIGISVSRKFGNAVARNKAKRIIRSICRELIPTMREGYYIIIRPEPGFRKINYLQAGREIESLFRKARILL